MHNQISLFLLTHKKEQAIVLQTSRRKLTFFVAFSRQYKLSTPKTCICQKHLDDTPLYIKHVREIKAISYEN